MSTETSQDRELTCGCGVAPDGAPGSGQGCSAGCMVPVPDGDRIRPWWQVAPFPGPNAKGEWDDPETFETACRAYFAAMALAYSRALEPAILAARTPEESARARDGLFRPMFAAFAAAASLDPGGDWTVNRVSEVMADPSDIADWCHDWVCAAGADPDEIEAVARW